MTRNPKVLSLDNLRKLGHVKKTLMKVIKEKCNDCVGADPARSRHHKVTTCTSTGCSLWPYRMGKNPFSTRGVMSEQKKKEVGERLTRSREKNI